MTWNIRKTLLGTAITLVILLVCVAAGLLPLNLFFLKSTLTDTVREHTGAELVVQGPLRLQLGARPKLTARDVLVRWPDESQPLSATIGQLSIRTRMASVWRGEIDLRSLTARGIAIDEAPVEITEWLPSGLQLNAKAPINESIDLALDGRIKGENWRLRLQGASLDELLTTAVQYPLSLTLAPPGSSLEFRGAVQLPWDAPRISGQMTAEAEDLSSLLSHLGHELPGLGDLSVQTSIELSDSLVELTALEGSLGDFSLTLSALVRDWSTRPWLEISANVPTIDTASLPGVKGGSADSDPETPLDLQPLFEQLSGFDGQAELTVGQVQHADFPAKDLVISANLEEGLVTISHASALVLGILATAQASLDTSASCARLETSLRVPELDLSILADLAQKDSSLEGWLENARITTVSCGVVPRRHLQRLETTLQADSLVLSDSDDQPPLELSEIDIAVNWNKAGRISFESELLGEPLTLAADFASVEHILNDELWPIALEARTQTVDLEFAGQTAIHETGLILDLTLAARLGNSDISGDLDWSGVGSGRPLKADFRSKLLDLEQLDNLFSDEEADNPGSIKDWSDFLDDAELLEHWHDVPSVDIKLAVDQLEGTPYEISRMGLDAHLEDRQLKGGRMQLDFEGVEMEGLLDVDMREPTARSDYYVTLKNLDIGHLMKTMGLSDTVNAHAEQMDLRFDSQGVTPRELIQNMSIDSTLQSLQWSFEAGPNNRPFDMNLSEVKVHAVPDADVTWETHGTLNGFPLNAWLKTPNLREAFNENTPLPLRLIVGSRSDITMFDLVIHPETDNSIRTEVRLSGRYSNEEGVDLSTLPSPLEDYSFSTDLTFRKNQYLASDIEARIGSSVATGRFSIQPSAQGFQFNLEADSPYIETDDLVLWVQEFRETKDFMDSPEKAASEETMTSASLVTMIDQYFDEFIGDNTWDVDIKVSELRSGGNLLGDSEFSLHMDGDEFVLDPARINLPGGNVSIKYSSINKKPDWAYDLDIYIERLEYGGLLRLFDPEATASGEIHVNTSLHSNSENVDEIVNHLEGTVDLAVFPDDVGAQFLDLWASNLVLALLPTGDNQQKKLNCMVARFEVENGIMTSKETFLDSTEIIVRARGEIDLANQQLDLLAAPQAKMEKFLSVSTPIAVTGPFDDFTVGVATGGFIKTLIRWYYGLIYVPWKWLTGERFPADGIATCYKAMDWELPTEAR